jgi:uncharacterized protein YndB with AHSA1/START domain
MTVFDVKQDPTALRISIAADFDASASRVWEILEDPRQLERWWGPPTWPATFIRHDFVVDGRSEYFMTGPTGERAYGWWQVTYVEAPRMLEFVDGFSDDAGVPNPEMPIITAVISLKEAPGRTRMTVSATFATLEQMNQVMAMGQIEGMTGAMGQIDAVLAEPSALSLGVPRFDTGEESLGQARKVRFTDRDGFTDTEAQHRRRVLFDDGRLTEDAVVQK